MISLKIMADAQRASAADALACSPEHLTRELSQVIAWNVSKRVVTDAAESGDKVEFARAFAAAGHRMTPAIEMLYLAARMFHCARSSHTAHELLRPEFDVARGRALELLSDPANCWLCDPRLQFTYRINDDDDDQSADAAALISCGLFGACASDLAFEGYENARPDFPQALLASHEFARALTTLIQARVVFEGSAMPNFLARHFDPQSLLSTLPQNFNSDNLETLLDPASETADAAAHVMWDRVLEHCAANPMFAARARVAASKIDMDRLLFGFIQRDRGSFESLVGKIAKINRLAGTACDGQYGGMERKSFWSGVATGQAAYASVRPFHEAAPAAFTTLMRAAIEHGVTPDMIVTFKKEADLFAFDFSVETSEIRFADALGKGVGASSAAMFAAMHVKAEMERRIGVAATAESAPPERPAMRRKRGV